ATARSPGRAACGSRPLDQPAVMRRAELCGGRRGRGDFRTRFLRFFWDCRVDGTLHNLNGSLVSFLVSGEPHMLDRYFRRRHVGARLRAGPFGQPLEEFAVYLHDRGHASMTVRLYMWGVEEFVRWIVSRKMTLAAIDEQLIRSFLGKNVLRGNRRSA